MRLASSAAWFLSVFIMSTTLYVSAALAENANDVARSSNVDIDAFDAQWAEEESVADESSDNDFDAAWSDDSAWGESISEASSANFWGLNGFLEWRLGARTKTDPVQDSATLRELRLALKKDWAWNDGQARLTTDLLFDASADSHHIDFETGSGWIDLREAWVQQQLGQNVDMKVGRQVLTWGVGDLLFINDLFPKDWQSFLLGRDEQYLKAPSDTLRLGWYNPALNIDLVYVPRFDSDRYIDGSRLSYFSPLANNVVGRNAIVQVDKPDTVGNDAEWALRLYKNISSFEVAVYAYEGFWKSPAGLWVGQDSMGSSAALPFNNEALIAAQPVATFPALRVLGASFRGPVGAGILSAEAGVYLSRDDHDGSNPAINNDEIRALLAYEWELMQETTIGLQYYVEALQDYDKYKAGLFPGQAARDEYRQLLTLRLTRLAMNQNLSIGLFAFYSPSDKDAYLRPKISYKANDSWTLETGLNLFYGKDTHTFFGQFENNSNAYLSFRYSF